MASGSTHTGWMLPAAWAFFFHWSASERRSELNRPHRHIKITLCLSSRSLDSTLWNILWEGLLQKACENSWINTSLKALFQPEMSTLCPSLCKQGCRCGGGGGRDGGGWWGAGQRGERTPPSVQSSPLISQALELYWLHWVQLSVRPSGSLRSPQSWHPSWRNSRPPSLQASRWVDVCERRGREENFSSSPGWSLTTSLPTHLTGCLLYSYILKRTCRRTFPSPFPRNPLTGVFICLLGPLCIITFEEVNE